MTTCNQKRGAGAVVRCPGCGEELVRSGGRGRPRIRCAACAKERHKQRLRKAKHNPAPAGSPRVASTPREEPREWRREDPREYGPAEPQLGMGPAQYRQYLRQRAVKLRREGLCFADITERLGVDVDFVSRAVAAARKAERRTQ